MRAAGVENVTGKKGHFLASVSELLTPKEFCVRCEKYFLPSPKSQVSLEQNICEKSPSRQNLEEN